MNYSLRNVQKCSKTPYIIIESEGKKIPHLSFHPDLHPKLEWSILGFLSCNFCAIQLTNQPNYKRTRVKTCWTQVSTYSRDTELSTTAPQESLSADGAQLSTHQLQFNSNFWKDQTLSNEHLIGPWVKVNHSTTEYCRQSSSEQQQNYTPLLEFPLLLKVSVN